MLDLEPMLWGEVFEPILADYDLSRQVRADPDSGTIVWPNDADWAPDELYTKSKAAIPA